MALLDTLSFTQLQEKCTAIVLKASIGDRIEYVFRLSTTSPRIVWKGSVVEVSPTSLLINWNGRLCGKGMKRGGTLRFPLKKMIEKTHFVVSITLGEPAFIPEVATAPAATAEEDSPASDEEADLFVRNVSEDQDAPDDQDDTLLGAPDVEEHDDNTNVCQRVPTQYVVDDNEARSNVRRLRTRRVVEKRGREYDVDEPAHRMGEQRGRDTVYDVDEPARSISEPRGRDTGLFGMAHFERMLTAVTTTIASSFARLNPPQDPYAFVSAMEEAKSGATWTKVCPGLRVTDVGTIPIEDQLFCPMLFLGRPAEIEEGLKDLRTLWSVSPRTSEAADELRLQQATVMELFSCTFPRHTKGDYEVILKQYARLISLLISASSWMGPTVSTKFATSFRSAWEGGKVDFVQLIRAATSTSSAAAPKPTVLQTTNASLADNAQRGGGRSKARKGIFRGGARAPAPPWRTNTVANQPQQQQPVFTTPPQPTHAAQQVGQKWIPPGYNQ